MEVEEVLPAGYFDPKNPAFPLVAFTVINGQEVQGNVCKKVRRVYVNYRDETHEALDIEAAVREYQQDRLLQAAQLGPNLPINEAVPSDWVGREKARWGAIGIKDNKLMYVL